MHVQEYGWVSQQQQLKWTSCLHRNNIIKCKKCNSQSSLFSNNGSYFSVVVVVVVKGQIIRGTTLIQDWALKWNHYTFRAMNFQSYEKGTTLGLLKKQNMICAMVISQCCCYLKWYVKCDNVNGLLSILLHLYWMAAENWLWWKCCLWSG